MSQLHPASSDSNSSDDEESGGHTKTKQPLQATNDFLHAASLAWKSPDDHHQTGRERAHGNPDMEARGLPMSALQHLARGHAAEASEAELPELRMDSLGQRFSRSIETYPPPFSKSSSCSRQHDAQQQVRNVPFCISRDELVFLPNFFSGSCN